MDVPSLLLLPSHPPIPSYSSSSLTHEEHCSGHGETWAGDEKAVDRKETWFICKSTRTGSREKREMAHLEELKSKNKLLSTLFSW